MPWIIPHAEQIARDRIDAQLRASGWVVQDKDSFNPNEGEGQAVREYTTDTGPADYVLFLVDTRNLGEQAEQEFLAYTPTDAQGGLGKMHALFGDHMDDLITDMNQALNA